MIADRRLLQGVAVGLVAASIGALYTVFARWGIGHGMQSTDMTFLRFAVAGVVTLPVLVRLVGIDAPAFLSKWRAWLAVSLLAGPLFGLLMFTALQWAPDLLPINRTSYFSKKSINPENDGHENKQIQRRANH